MKPRLSPRINADHADRERFHHRGTEARRTKFAPLTPGSSPGLPPRFMPAKRLKFFRLLHIVVSLINDHNSWVFGLGHKQVIRYWIPGINNKPAYRVCSVALQGWAAHPGSLRESGPAKRGQTYRAQGYPAHVRALLLDAKRRRLLLFLVHDPRLSALIRGEKSLCELGALGGKSSD